MSTKGEVRSTHRLHRLRPAGAQQIIRILAALHEGEAQGPPWPDFRHGDIERAIGGALAALSPSNSITGSSAIRQSSCSCSIVNAVPSGATTLG